MRFGYKNKMFYVPYFLSKRWDTDGPTRPKMCTEAVLQQTEAVLQQIGRKRQSLSKRPLTQAATLRINKKQLNLMLKHSTTTGLLTKKRVGFSL